MLQIADELIQQCGLPLLLDRIKQDSTSCQLLMTFLRKRALLEDDYGRNSIKLARATQEAYRDSDGKAGSFVASYQAILKAHESLGENRVRFAQQMNEMADQLNELQKEVERARKLSKDQGTVLEKQLRDAETSADKAKGRFEAAQEELERLLVLKAGESTRDSNNTPYASSHISSPSLPSSSTAASVSSINGGKDKRTFGKAMSKIKAVSGTSSYRNPAQVARMEEELRTRCGAASDAYTREIRMTSSIRQDHFKREMPRVLRALKESADEVDLGTQYHLARYAHLFEHVLVQDGLIVTPAGTVEEATGMKSLAESIDNREDFRVFMSNYAVAFSQSGVKPLRRDGPEDSLNDSRRPSVASSSGAFSGTTAATTAAPSIDRRTFGVDLSYQMARDSVDAPLVLVKCAAVIEAHGLEMTGIYRLSGTTSRVQRLKATLDRGAS